LGLNFGYVLIHSAGYFLASRKYKVVIAPTPETKPSRPLRRAWQREAPPETRCPGN
jgi:hypothetical protein